MENRFIMDIHLSDHFSYSRLMRFALPSIATMIFTSIYGVVDGFFVSNYAGKTPFAAVNLIMPVLLIMATSGFMFGTGGSAIVAAAFGEGKPEDANRYFSLFVYFTFLSGVILGVVGTVFLRPIAEFLGASGELLHHCIVYGRINLMSLPFFTLQLLFQNFFATAEKPKLGLTVSILSGVTNMVLDAVLVINLPGPYKLAGAAAATAMSEFVGGTLPLIYFARKNSSILKLGRTRFEGRVLLKAAANGSSEFMNNISMCIVSMLYNFQLLKYAGENGVAAYGVMMYVSLVFSAAFIGYSIGTAPLVGYHYGAENSGELANLRKKSLRIITVFGVCMTVAAELLAIPLSALFVGYDAELEQLTISGFRVFAVSFLFMGFGIYGSGFFTALGNGVVSALIAFLRTLVFEAAAVMLLPLVFGIRGIWFALVISEIMAALFTAFFMKKMQPKYKY